MRRDCRPLMNADLLITRQCNSLFRCKAENRQKKSFKKKTEYRVQSKVLPEIEEGSWTTN